MKTIFASLIVVLPFVGGSRAADEFKINDAAEFVKVVSSSAQVTKLAGDFRFVEGPVWIPSEDGGFLIFSDIPADELKKWTKADGLSTFRNPSDNANGNTLDLDGRLITCEHGARRVSVTGADGTVKTLVDRFQGNRLNSPNDAAVKSDGSIWFTDPDYGLGSREKEVDGNFVYRLNPKSGDLSILIRDFDKPNGICFSPDETKLYVADSGQPKHIRVFDVRENGTADNGKVFCKIDVGGPDGIRCDTEGRIWSSAGDGVQIFGSDGHLIGKILTPESPANLCFGGADGKTLFITARTSLYSIRVLVRGNHASR